MIVPDLGDLPVFPCWRSPDPKLNKRPANAHSFKGATHVDPPRAWGLVGVPTGEATGFDVLDIDPAGTAWYDQNFDALPATRAHSTQRDGVHLLFRHREGLRGNNDGRIAPGVDVRSAGGYVIWWPRQGLPFEDYPLSEWPDWLVEAAMKPPRNDAANRKPDKQHVGDGIGALAKLDPRAWRNFEDWLRLMTACKVAGIEAEAFVAWSTGDPQYAGAADEVRGIWARLTPDGRITAETLWRAVRVAELDEPPMHGCPLVGVPLQAISELNPSFQPTGDLQRRMRSIMRDVERGDEDVLFKRACLVRWIIAEGSLSPHVALVLLDSACLGRDRERYRATIAAAWRAVELKLAPAVPADAPEPSDSATAAKPSQRAFKEAGGPSGEAPAMEAVA